MTDLTEQQRANLAQLAAYLRTLPADYDDFDMMDFASDDPEIPHIIDCGTVACAVGHAPRAGIPPKDGDSWHSYSQRELTPEGDLWFWCFSSQWCDVDNTAAGAAARIDYLLANGLPDNADAQRFGRAPLCYLSLLAAPRAGEGVNRG